MEGPLFMAVMVALLLSAAHTRRIWVKAHKDKQFNKALRSAASKHINENRNRTNRGI